MSFIATSPAIRTVVVLTALALAPLQGCFVFLEEDESISISEQVPSNYAPTILSDLSWWHCDYSPFEDEYFFEFQAVVDDLDGWSDVAEVNIYFYDAGSAVARDSFTMHYEGEGVWGGLVWESETFLFCGDATDAIIEAWDFFDANDLLTIDF